MEIAVSVLLVLGSFFMLTGAIGILRMPDLYMRMSANTKAVTLGVGLLLLAVALYFREIGVVSRAVATGVFIVLTIPISSHLIGRAAYLVGVPLWSETIRDELRKLYPEERPQAGHSALQEVSHSSETPEGK